MSKDNTDLLKKAEKAIINMRWQFLVFDQEEDRFLTPEEMQDLRISMTCRGHLFFSDGPMRYLFVHYTGLKDDFGEPLLEGDIIECDQVTEFGLIKRNGVIQFSREIERYSLNVFTESNTGESAPAENIKRVCNGLENKQLFNEITKPSKAREA